MIDACEFQDRLDPKFTPEGLRHQADLVQENDALCDEMLAALIGNAPAPSEVFGAPIANDHVTEHLYACRTCGQMVDMRDLSQVLHHEKLGHQPLLRN
jgi:hypothetical protein